MASQFNSATHTKIQTIVNSITTNTGVDFDLKKSAGFRIILDVSPDGQTVAITTKPSDQGQSNAFGASDGQTPPNLARASAKIIPGNSLP